MTGDQAFDSYLAEAPTLSVKGQTLVLDPGTLWVVLSGSLDLFLAGTDPEAPPLARRFVMRTEAGQGCLGVATMNGKGLIAVALGNTVVARLDLDDCPTGAGFCALVEDWVQCLQAVSALQSTPGGRVRRVGSNKVLNAPVDGRMTAAGHGPVVWIPHWEGLLDLEDQTATWCVESSYFPLSQSVWITVREEAQLQPLSTSDWAQTEHRSSDLENFQELCVRRLLFYQELELDQHCRRLEEKADKIRRQTKESLHSLSHILDADRLEALDIGAAPLRQATDRLGRALGVPIRPSSQSEGELGSLLQSLARANQLRVRPVRLRDDWWLGGGNPMIGCLLDSGTPVCLESNASGRYTFWDPNKKAVIAVDKAVAAKLEPDAFSFYRTFPAKALSLLELIRFWLFGSGPDLGTVLLVLLAAAGLSTLIPILTGVLFGTIIPQSQPGQLLPLVLALVVSALASACFDITRSLAMLRFQGRSMGNVEAAVWDRLINLPLSFFRNYSSGNLANRAQALTSILQLLTGLAAGAVMGGIVSLANFALLFHFDHRLAFTATGLALFAVVVTLVGGYRNLAYGRVLNELESRLNGLLMQLLAGVGKLRVAGAEDRAFNVWAKEFSEVRRLEVSQRKVSNWLTVFHSAYPLLAVMAIYATVAAVGQETIDTATFLAFNAAFGSFFSAFLSMGSSTLALLDVVPLFEQARPILQAVPEHDPTKVDPGELSGGFEFSHVEFGYSEDGPKVLKDVTFKVHPGEYVAVVGPSGAGKSTVARLLLGLESPSGGTISYDGKDLSQLDSQALRRRMGVVLQNVQLLPGSILSAIVGNSSATGEDAWEAARMAGLESDLKAMPMGLQTWISEGGGTLSGGQKQRLTIARAIVGKPKILILDEATSALDNESQATVTDSLSQLSATRIVIAHRLSTIRDADRILVLENGVVAQEGTFDQLTEQPGTFRDLVQRQVFE
jgi:NHLM bacteriocin system ABC transporter ATP-binding protein